MSLFIFACTCVHVIYGDFGNVYVALVKTRGYAILLLHIGAQLETSNNDHIIIIIFLVLSIDKKKALVLNKKKTNKMKLFTYHGKLIKNKFSSN